MSETNYYEFPTCLHALSAALHINGIDPGLVTISLPVRDWWKLSQVLQTKFKHLTFFDGRQHKLDSFMYLGFKFVPDKEQK